MDLQFQDKNERDFRETMVEEDEFATTKRSMVSQAVASRVSLSSIELPQEFGRYEMRQLVGEGAMGAVFAAHDSQLDRTVAIKIPKFTPDDQKKIQRFDREARAMAKLRHPNLCPIYDVGQIDETRYLSMAYIEGATLADQLPPGEPWPVDETVQLVHKLALALDAAHQGNVVHRDMKPANIIIDAGGEPVIMDFGLARFEGLESSLTRHGHLIGTPAYMSPEQVRGKHDLVGPAADVYSLGAIMYQMLTGHLPFKGGVTAVLQAVIEDDPPAPSQYNEQIDTALEAICMRAMAKEVDDRYVSAAEFAEELSDYLAQSEGSTDATESSEAIDRLSERVNIVRSMWKKEQFAAALTILEEMATTSEPSSESYVDWARGEIPKVKAKIEEEKKRSVQMPTAQIPAVVPTLPQPPQPTFPQFASPPSFAQIRQNDETPRWLFWLIPVPVVVIIFLTVLVLSSNWRSDTRASVTEARDSDLASLTTNQDEESKENRSDSEETLPDAQATGNASEVKNEPFTPSSNEEPPDRGESPLDGERPREFGHPPMPSPESGDSPERRLESPGDDFSHRDREPFDRPPRGGDDTFRPPPRRSPKEVFDVHDENRDGFLVSEELPPHHREHILRADSNADGKVSLSELETAHKNHPPGPPPGRPFLRAPHK